jgi:hypothetical protein
MVRVLDHGVLLVALVLASGCTNSIAGLDARRREAALAVPRKLDLLLVVDTSPAMQQTLAAVSQAAANRATLLLDEAGRVPDVRIGFLAADLGGGPSCAAPADAAQLLHQPRVAGCPSPREPWIAASAGATNITGCTSSDVATCVDAAFRCISPQTAAGCVFTQPLETLRRAVDPTSGTSSGFVRSDALLAVVFITDQDDCSAARPAVLDPDATPTFGGADAFRCFLAGVQCVVSPDDPRTPGTRSGCNPSGAWLQPAFQYVDFLRQLKPDGWLIVGLVAASREPVTVIATAQGPQLAASCDSADGRGTPPIRLRSVVDVFGTSSFVRSICQRDCYEQALAGAGEAMRARWR